MAANDQNTEMVETVALALAKHRRRHNETPIGDDEIKGLLDWAQVAVAAVAAHEAATSKTTPMITSEGRAVEVDNEIVEAVAKMLARAHLRTVMPAWIWGSERKDGWADPPVAPDCIDRWREHFRQQARGIIAAINARQQVTIETVAREAAKYSLDEYLQVRGLAVTVPAPAHVAEFPGNDEADPIPMARPEGDTTVALDADGSWVVRLNDDGNFAVNLPAALVNLEGDGLLYSHHCDALLDTSFPSGSRHLFVCTRPNGHASAWHVAIGTGVCAVWRDRANDSGDATKDQHAWISPNRGKTAVVSWDKTAVVSWDWKESVDVESLTRAVAYVSGGTVYVRAVDNTGSDQIAIVISREPLDDDGANQVWDQYLDGDS